jgi:cyclase
MLTKRLIFTLLYDNGSFMLSRNFRLQKIGDLNWLEDNYGFANVGYQIDELVVIDVSRQNRDTAKFCEDLKRLTRDCFAPIAAGGGIKTLEHARELLRSGADKVIVNSALHDQPELVENLAREFGRQCIVASVDTRKIDNSYRVLKHNRHRSLVELTLETGRRHQIRVQLSSLGCPIVGDEKYGAKSDPAGRLGLHSSFLRLIHPVTSQELRFTSPLPKPLAKLLVS